MAKIQFSDKPVDSFGGLDIFRTFFNKNADLISNALKTHLGSRPKQSKYSYEDVLFTFMSSCLVGGSFIEDFNRLKQRMPSGHFQEFCSPDTFTNVMCQLSEHRNFSISESCDKDNETLYSYFFNSTMNDLLISFVEAFDPESLQSDILDHDHSKLFSSKHDSKYCYKGQGYYTSLFCVNNTPLYVSMQDGNAVPKKELVSVLEAGLSALQKRGKSFKIFRADGAAYNKDVIQKILQYCPYFVTRANKSAARQEPIKAEMCSKVVINPACKSKNEPDREFLVFEQKDNFAGTNCRRIFYKAAIDSQPDLFSEISFFEIITNLPQDQYSTVEIIQMYQNRGASERLFDELKNDYNAAHLPMSAACYNLTCLIVCCIAKIFIQAFKVQLANLTNGYVRITHRIKRLTFLLISIPAKIIRHGRRVIYTLFSKDIRLRPLVPWVNS